MVDTHVHIWNLKRANYAWLENESEVLKRDFSIEQWEEVATADKIECGVLVQAANNLEDTDLMLDAMNNSPRIAGIVGWLPLQQPEEAERLLQTKFSGDTRLKGIRHLIHNEADSKWLLQPEVIESLKLLARHGLTYDIVGITTEHVETALKVAEKVPELFMVFDHLNQPPIAKGDQFGRWGELMKKASVHPNFYAKISGLGNPSGKPFTWSSFDIESYIGFTLTHFGENRCFCGSDWPVCLLNGSYDYTVQQYFDALGRLLSTAQLQQVLTLNASKFYNLRPK